MKKSLSLKSIKQLDKADMLGLLLDFPQQCMAAKTIADGVKIRFEKKNFNNIVFLGLGGSAIGGDLVRTYLYSESKLPIQVFREYDLPEFIGESTLCFIISYSGNTEETLSSYEEAGKRGSTIIILSSDGKLKEWALRDNNTFIEIAKGLPPRCSLGYLSIIPLCILARLGMIKDVALSINQSVRILEELKRKSLHPAIGGKDNIAKAAALKLCGKFAVIYSASANFDICAIRMRGQLAENSKAIASSHLFPEMNHNEIVGWENPQKLFKNFIVVMLRDKKIHPRTAKRMDITKEIIKKEGVEVLDIWSRGEDLLSRIFSLIYIGDFISFYLAVAYAIDPTPVEKVTYLKGELAKIK